MAVRLKFEVAYDGGSFAGWQSQSHANTVQDCLERAFNRLFSASLRVNGAGRTDAGVHALRQCGHIDVPSCVIAPDQLVRAVNALLPASIRILACRRTNDTFHARYSAKGKVYRYRIFNGGILSPFEHGRVWHVHPAVDLEQARLASGLFVGTHNFRGFAANRGAPVSDTTRTVHAVTVARAGQMLRIEFEGDGFLYKMVRMMVGGIVMVATGKIALADLRQQLISGKAPAARLTAPAAGLFLVRIRY